LAAGFRVASYRLEEQVGAGGMAVVFRALDERLGRQVAVKVLAPALAWDEDFRRRFIRESRAAAAVDDPHIIPVYEAGESGGVLFIAMRYVPGGDVRSLLRREGPLPPGQVSAIVSPVASALDAAHAAGLVHRDVKPTNMLLDVRPERPDHVYLSDFGLSKGMLSAALTGPGQFLGTPDYVAPEQIQGKPLDGQADQYALACAAFEMLTGQAPFRRDEAIAAIWSHLSEPPPSLADLRPELPAEADQVFARALAKAPADRYPRCPDFAESLRRALGLPSYISPAAPPEQPRGVLAGPPPTVSVLPAQDSRTMPPQALPQPDPTPASPGPGVPAAGWRRLAVGGAVAAAAVVVYMVIAAVTHAFPFAGPHHTGAGKPIVRATLTSPNRIAPLARLLPRDMPASSCSSANPADYNFQIPGTAQSLDCQDGNWSGIGIQTDSYAHYLTAWQNFNNWLGIDPSSAGANCPPQGGNSQGILPWSNKYFPQRDGQVLVCWTYISGGSPFPSYAWSFPTEHAFLWVSGKVGTTFAALDTCWRTNQTQAVSPSQAAS
jgi:serine/threonine-protein kinase